MRNHNVRTKNKKNMNKRTNKRQGTPVADTFKGMLLMSMGVPVGNIRPYRLKSAPSCLGGFERMSVAAARASGVDIPKAEKESDEVCICRLGPAVFREWMPAWMFEAAFEPVPEQRRGDRIRTLTEEMNSHHVAEKALNERCYALSVELLSECGGSLDDNGEQSSTYLSMSWTVTPWNWSSRTRRSGKTGKSSSWVTVTTRARSTGRNVT